MTRPVHLTPLTPLAFMERAADVFADQVAIVHGARRVTYRQLAARATRLAHALRASGIQPGDRVAYLAPNVPELLVAHFGVPLAGAVLVAINTRLAPDEVATILDHSGARLLVVDTELAGTVAPIRDRRADLGEVVLLDDLGVSAPIDGTRYADLLARGTEDPLPWAVGDDTTGPPVATSKTRSPLARERP